MEIKKTMNLSYHIEEKPGGGYIAHPSDPQMETFEGATEEEIEAKIGAKVTGMISQQMPFGLGKLFDMALTKAEFAYHIEQKSGGGFIAQSKDSGHETLEAATRQELEKKIRARLQTLIGQQFAGSGGKLGDVTVSRKFNAGNHTTFHFSTFAGPGAPKMEQDLLQASLPQSADSMGPILPAKDTSGLILRILGALLVIGALIYFFFLRR